MTDDTSRVHPLVKLDFVVRLVACPIPALIVVSSRISAGETLPVAMWLALAGYGLVWPHAALHLARRDPARSRDREQRFLLIDSAVAGAAVALTSFQLVPTLALVTGYASMLASVGGLPLLGLGMLALVPSALLTASLVTGFAVRTDQSLVSTALAALLLVGFQLLLGLQTSRSARRFIASSRRIAEQAEEIRARNEELVEAREEALQAARAKEAFLATMSHEIRTPLNGVLGMTRLLEETPHTPQQGEFLHTIQVSGNTLLAVVNDILDYSRIESGRMELEAEPLRLTEVVEEALEIVADRARDKGLELVCDIGPEVPETILGDVTRLRQVMTNLVGNAVKFTERGEVVVRVRLVRAEAERSPMEIAFEVRDTGIGIPEDRIPALFAPFSQADASTTRRYGGTGLGLAICKRLTELMGGTISVDSIEGEGATFRFTIQARAAAASAVLPDEVVVGGSGRPVLVVDDNGTNRRVLCAQLASWGFVPEEAAGAAEALGALGSESAFDLAILDLHMPDVDGLSLAGQIRQLPRRRELPLILLSSSLVQAKDDPDGLFIARLLKPARQSRLYDAVLKALGARVHDRPVVPPDRGIPRLAEAAPLSILVADDNEINREVAGLVFRRFGYQAEFAVNGRDAVDQVVGRALASGRLHPFDLVFMDVHMPEMDGLEATRAIRQRASERPEARWPRIVAMTADAMLEDRERCLAAGMDDYLSKPLDFDAVRGVLEGTAAGLGIATRRAAAPAPDPREEPPRPQPEAAPRGPRSTMDWSRLEELRSFDTPDGAVVRGAIAAFVAQAPGALSEVRGGASRRDGGALRSSAHALKGAATNVGAVAVAEVAARLEAAGKLGTLEEVDQLVEDLAISLVQTLADLHRGVPEAVE